MSKIQFKSRQSGKNRSKLRIALIVTACVVGAILVAAGVFFAVIYFKQQPDGEASLIGTYAPAEQAEFVVREYRDYFSEELTRTLEQYDPAAEPVAGLYELYNLYGRKISEFCGEWDGEGSPESFRDEQLAAFQSRYLYSDEDMKEVQFFLYLPAESYCFRVSGAEVGEESLSVTVEVIPGEGTAQAYTLTGTYQMDGNNGTAVYAQTELPLAILEKLQSFRYRSTINDSNVYVNAITFFELITLEQ